MPKDLELPLLEERRSKATEANVYVQGGCGVDTSYTSL